MTETKRSRNAKAAQEIIEVLKANPNLNANQVAARISTTPNSAKATLNRLTKLSMVTRVKQPLEIKPKIGPQSVYVYSAV